VVKRTLLVKVTALIGASLVLLALVLAAAASVHLAGALRAEAVERGRAVSASLAAALPALPQPPSPALSAVFEATRTSAGLAYVELTSPSGVVLARAPPGDGAITSADLVEAAAAAPSGERVRVGVDLSSTESRVRAAWRWLLVVSAAALLVAFAAAAALARRAVAPLRALTQAAQRAVEGDLARRIDVETDDEIGELASAFRRMIDKLVEMLGALQESARLLTEAGGKLSSSTQEQSHTVTRQATALQETQVTAQEIKQTSLLAAQKAEAVLRLTEKADEVSTSGEEAIERSLGGLTDIRAQVEDISQRIAQLSERTQQIGSITATVKDLADQSNMLALNAAIEAVRSGEHGKGFAVVAREIRSLADQSIHATNRVREILEDIGGAIRGAVAITERGAQKIEGGLLQVKASGENLRELSNIVKDNSSAVRQIAAAVSQQNAGITQIFGAVTDQTRMMDETMRRLETTTQAAAVLKDLSQRVSDVVKRFRV
jgi:methyl-accepting chemotaxis protein